MRKCLFNTEISSIYKGNCMRPIKSAIAQRKHSRKWVWGKRLKRKKLQKRVKNVKQWR